MSEFFTITELKWVSRVNLTGTPQTLKELFPNAPQEAISNLKTIVIFNNSGANVYFGHDSGIDQNNSSIIKNGTYREFTFNNWDITAYFMSTVNGNIAVELYT